MPTRRKERDERESSAERLDRLIAEGVTTAKKARRHRQSPAGVNFYADRIARLRADATNVFGELVPPSAGDAAALAELIETVFSIDQSIRRRVEAARHASFSLRTTWKSASRAATEEDGLLPLSLLSQTKRSYLVTIGRQMNGAFSMGWFAASAVMMRRLIEICLIEAFEENGIAHKIKDSDDNYFPLSELVSAALCETTWSLSRNSKRALPALRDVGHLSAHGRYFHVRKEDMERHRPDCRVVVEEFLHHAKLL